jgi:hypothetical protein
MHHYISSLKIFLFLRHAGFLCEQYMFLCEQYMFLCKQYMFLCEQYMFLCEPHTWNVRTVNVELISPGDGL